MANFKEVIKTWSKKRLYLGMARVQREIEDLDDEMEWYGRSPLPGVTSADIPFELHARKAAADNLEDAWRASLGLTSYLICGDSSGSWGKNM